MIRTHHLVCQRVHSLGFMNGCVYHVIFFSCRNSSDITMSLYDFHILFVWVSIWLAYVCVHGINLKDQNDVKIGGKTAIPLKFWYSMSLTKWKYLCMSEPLFSQCHFDTRVNLPKYEGICMVHRPKWHHKKQKNCKFFTLLVFTRIWDSH